MKTISLKLDDDIFEQTENIVKQQKKPRSRYINEALAYFNKMKEREILREKLRISSLLVREDNLEVLREFEALHDEIPE